MKLISLNTWGGKLLDPLLDFIKEKSNDTDIFCFQEIFSGGEGDKKVKDIEPNLLDKISALLPNYDFHYQPGATPYRHGPGIVKEIIKEKPLVGTATFIRKDIKILNWEGFLTYPEEMKKEFPFDLEGAGILLNIDARKDGKEFSIANIHGLWGGGPKDDSLARLFQSRRVLDCLRGKKGAKILIGDFNLRPDTESISMIEKEMWNLIQESKIQTTRNHYYEGMEKYQDYIADYCFVSKDLKLKDFKVLPDEISDHQPLYLEFD